MASTQFKVGDRVRVKTGMEDYRGPGGIMGFGRLVKSGKTGVITSTVTGGVTGILQPLVKFDGTDYSKAGFFDELEAETAEFSVGDSVRVVRRDHARDWYTPYVGKEGTVTETMRDTSLGTLRLKVKFSDGDFDSGFASSVEKVGTPAAEFKPGDVVTLKSGGPKMTVAREDSLGVFVDYFDAGDFCHRSFSKAVLCRVPQ